MCLPKGTIISSIKLNKIELYPFFVTKGENIFIIINQIIIQDKLLLG